MSSTELLRPQETAGLENLLCSDELHEKSRLVNISADPKRDMFVLQRVLVEAT